jgi:hypothetical protein
MVKKAAIKGVSKFLKRRRTIGGIKKKPTPRYRKDSKTGETFLNRRKVLAGVKGATVKAPRKPGYVEGAATGAIATAAAMKYNEGKKAKAKETKDKLKRATDKIRKKDKEKKEKRRKYGKAQA